MAGVVRVGEPQLGSLHAPNAVVCQNNERNRVSRRQGARIGRGEQVELSLERGEEAAAGPLCCPAPITPPPVLVYMLVVPSASETIVADAPAAKPISTSAPQTDVSGSRGSMPSSAGGLVRSISRSPW